MPAIADYIQVEYLPLLSASSWKKMGGKIYKLNSVYSIENLMEKKKFYPRKICIFVLQLHRVAYCLDELECAPCGTGSSQV